jgi:coatomer protein complex subunit epsilon
LIPGIQALVLRAKYEQATDETSQLAIIDELKTLLASNPSTSVQLTCAHVFLSHGSTKDALQCVHLGVTMEHILLCLQIYLKMDRLDLAKQQLSMLQQADEDSVIAQLGSVYYMIACGRSSSGDAVHILQALSEQYGPSPYLLNLLAASYMVSGNYTAAEQSLTECRAEFSDSIGNSQSADTLINLLVCCQQQGKSWDGLLDELKQSYPSHPYVAGVDRVTTALERESVKYKV